MGLSYLEPFRLSRRSDLVYAMFTKYLRGENSRASLSLNYRFNFSSYLYLLAAFFTRTLLINTTNFVMKCALVCLSISPMKIFSETNVYNLFKMLTIKLVTKIITCRKHLFICIYFSKLQPYFPFTSINQRYSLGLRNYGVHHHHLSPTGRT